MSREGWLKQVIQTGLQLRDQSHDSSRFVTMVRGVRFRLIYLYLLQVRDAARDAAARFPNIFLA